MLISCPECERQVSDKAISCPNCGYPINLSLVVEKPLQSSARRRKFHKLPNGFGSIRKLGGNRRKPYAVYPPVTAYNDNGSPIRRKSLGYFESYNDAFACLVEYNNNPSLANNRMYTFKQVYEMFYAEKYNNAKRQYSDSSKYSTTSAYNHLEKLHNMKMADIKASDVQTIIDSCELKHASLETMVMVFKEVSKYALKNDLIDKDYSQYIKINSADDDEKGVPFTVDEIKVLWKHKDDPTVKVILILLCTGCRISELEKLEYIKNMQCFRGGLKTRAGKDRIIPIHNDILDYIGELEGFKAQKWRTNFWYAKLEELGLSKSIKGTLHTPHDCRHTFSWAWDKYVIPRDDLAKRLVMGHTLGNDVESSVYGHRTENELLEKVNMLYKDIFTETIGNSPND